MRPSSKAAQFQHKYRMGSEGIVINNLMHLPWQEEQSACGEPVLCHDLAGFNVDLVTLGLLDPQRVQELL